MEKIHFDAVKISGCIMDSGLIASLLSSYWVPQWYTLKRDLGYMTNAIKPMYFVSLRL
jgi:hypothetical protein